MADDSKTMVPEQFPLLQEVTLLDEYPVPQLPRVYTSKVPGTNPSQLPIIPNIAIIPKMGITGTWEGYTSSPLYLYNNGSWSNIQVTGLTGLNSYGYGTITYESNRIVINAKTSDYGIFFTRLNQTFNLSNYNFIKSEILSTSSSGTTLTIGISKSQNVTAKSQFICYSDLNRYSGINVLDISTITGDYYIYLCVYINTCEIGSLFLTTV